MKTCVPITSLVALALVSCSRVPEPEKTVPQETETSSPAFSKGVVVSMMPSDLMSQVGETPLTVWVQPGDAPVSADTLNAIARSVRLRRFPDGAAVSYSVEIGEPTPLPEGPSSSATNDKSGSAAIGQSPDNPGRAAIRIVPSSKLENAWHVLSIQELPTGVTGSRFTGVADPRFGAYSVRFHPGAAPVLREVEACSDPTSGAGIFMVRFSESLPPTGPSKDQLSVLAGANRSLCELVAPPPGSIPDSTAQFRCPSSELSRWQASLVVGPSLMSSSGGHVKVVNSAAKSAADLYLPTPFQTPLGLDAVPEHRAGCRMWHSR